MTDKHIIIDGVDVSGCEHRCDTHKTLLADGSIMEFANYCQINNDGCYAINCYFKQLKRKVEEYEALKAELEQYKKSKQASYEQLQKRCNELELEKRKLKERLDQWISKCEQETKLKEFHKNETDEYKNTLLYIKEIANAIVNGTHFTDNIEEHFKELNKQILQKISEVIKDEEI